MIEDRISELEDTAIEFTRLNNREKIDWKKIEPQRLMGNNKRSNTQKSPRRIPKPDKDRTKKRKLQQATTSPGLRHKNPQQNISKINPKMDKRTIHHGQMEFIPCICKAGSIF